MTKGQIELIRRLAEIIELIAGDPDSISVDYIQRRYLEPIVYDENLKDES